MNQTKKLRELLERPGIILAPGCYDGMSARLIEQAGYDVAYMTGFGSSASVLGMPDTGLMSFAEMSNHAANLAAAINIPLIADADTGYGNAVNTYRTVRAYARSGVAGVQIEDQVSPKKCGHTKGKQVVPLEVAVLGAERAHTAPIQPARVLGMPHATTMVRRHVVVAVPAGVHQRLTTIRPFSTSTARSTKNLIEERASAPYAASTATR